MSSEQQKNNSEQRSIKNHVEKLNKCIFCLSNLEDSEQPKLLPCLHSICGTCYNSGSMMLNINSNPHAIVCKACKQKGDLKQVVDNLFLMEKNKNKCSTVCVMCEDGSIICAFCMECKEWMCKNCQIAHSKVKLTKTHTVNFGSQETGSQINNLSQEYTNCPEHKKELLTYFCGSCGVLTCKDCQLYNHKDHNYEHFTSAYDKKKNNLIDMMQKIKKKRDNIGKVLSLAPSKKLEIDEHVKLITKEMKKFEVKLIKDVKERIKQFHSFIVKDFMMKDDNLNAKVEDLTSIAEELEWCETFTQTAIDSGSELALIHNEKSILGQLDHVMKKRCPNIMSIDIDFSFNENKCAKVIEKIGAIIMDRTQFSNKIQDDHPLSSNSLKPQMPCTSDSINKELNSAKYPSSSNMIFTSGNGTHGSVLDKPIPENRHNLRMPKNSRTNPFLYQQLINVHNRSTNPLKNPQMQMNAVSMARNLPHFSHIPNIPTAFKSSTGPFEQDISMPNTKMQCNTSVVDTLINATDSSYKSQIKSKSKCTSHKRTSSEDNCELDKKKPAIANIKLPTTERTPFIEKVCSVCHTGGTLVLCKTCPRMFHPQCYITELTNFSNCNWTCLICANLDACYPSEKKIGIKRTRAIYLYSPNHLLCERITLEIFCHPKASPFHPAIREYLNTYEGANKPMDINIIKAKLNQGQNSSYQNVDEFINDVKICLQSYLDFFKMNSTIRDEIQLLYSYILKKFDEYFS